MSQQITHIEFLRHGACEGGEIYRGSTDVALTDEGWQQMSAAIAERSGWQRIISSPLLRCKHFAEHTANERQTPLEFFDGFREMNFGEWEGQPLKEVWEKDFDRVNAFYRDPENNAPPGGESIQLVSERIEKAWQHLLENYAGEKLLVICHGGVMRVLMCQLLGMSVSRMARLHIPYACVASIRVIHGKEGNFPVLQGFG